MPTTFVGLVIFIAFLAPGFLHTAQRRVLAPHPNRSPFMETTSVVSISLATNALIAIGFGLVRWVLPSHTPDVGRILATGSDYWIEHLPYVASWTLVLFVGSCALAVLVARFERLRRRFTATFAPIITDSSAWCEALNTEAGAYTHAGLELADGGYVSGRVVWFSTDLDETGDRELVLGPPLKLRTDEGPETLKAERVIVAARNIVRIDVTYVDEPAPASTA